MPTPNTHNSATSTAWSFDHPDEDTISPEQFIGLAYAAFKLLVTEMETIVKEEGILAISEYVIDIFDTVDEPLNENKAEDKRQNEVVAKRFKIPEVTT